MNVHGATLTRRQFVKTGGVLMVGITVAGPEVLKGARAAERPDGKSPDPTLPGSWFDIHADNTLTIRTGSCDFGQSSTTTSFRQIVADELNFPYESITAVIEGLRHLVAEVRNGRMAADHALFGAMFHYIETFPEKLHHPKEDDFLFARLRERRPDAGPLLDGLEREHEVGRERFVELKAKWEAFRADPAKLDAFAGCQRLAGG